MTPGESAQERHTDRAQPFEGPVIVTGRSILPPHERDQAVASAGGRHSRTGNYCSERRRHLSGALVCPGCGACAPDIAPPATGRAPAPRAETPAASGNWGSAPVDGGNGGAASAGTRRAASRPESA